MSRRIGWPWPSSEPNSIVAGVGVGVEVHHGDPAEPVRVRRRRSRRAARSSGRRRAPSGRRRLAATVVTAGSRLPRRLLDVAGRHHHVAGVETRRSRRASTRSAKRGPRPVVGAGSRWTRIACGPNRAPGAERRTPVEGRADDDDVGVGKRGRVAEVAPVDAEEGDVRAEHRAVPRHALLPLSHPLCHDRRPQKRAGRGTGTPAVACTVRLLVDEDLGELGRRGHDLAAEERRNIGIESHMSTTPTRADSTPMMKTPPMCQCGENCIVQLV